MKIGVISDTHDRLPTFRRALSLFRRLKVEAVLHAGDLVAPFAAKLIAQDTIGGMPVYVCYGNNDGERAGLKTVLPQIVDGPLHVTLGDGADAKRIVMHHFIDWLDTADYTAPDGSPVDIVITGHTHEIVNEVKPNPAHPDRETLFLNPGECCGWVRDRCTVALLDLKKPLREAAEIVEVQG